MLRHAAFGQVVFVLTLLKLPDNPRLVGRMYRCAGGIQAEANNPLVQNDNATKNYFF